MKRILMALSILFASVSMSSAFAGNEGPQAVPPASDVIAVFAVSSGFVPPTAPYYTSVEVLRTGWVRSVEHYFDGHEVTELVTRLAPKELNSLKGKIAQVLPGEFYDSNPQMPPCMDAPTVDYSIIRDSGEKIGIASTRGCKDMARENAQPVDAEIVSALDALAALMKK